MSQRSTKRPKYNVDGNSGEEEGDDDEDNDDDEGGFQRLKKNRPTARSQAKAPEQSVAEADPEPGPSRLASFHCLSGPALSFCLACGYPQDLHFATWLTDHVLSITGANKLQQMWLLQLGRSLRQRQNHQGPLSRQLCHLAELSR